jgi:hypothetical protein
MKLILPIITALLLACVTLNEKVYFELIDILFKECYDLLYDKKEHLYYRDLRYKWDADGVSYLQKKSISNF